MYDFIDDSFNRENSQENILSIQLSLNGFSFCIQHSNDKRILRFKHRDIKISTPQLISRLFADWCNEEDLLTSSYRQKQVIFAGSQFSLIPQQLESEALKSDLQALLLNRVYDEYAENWIENIKAKVIFPLPTDLNKTIQEQLGLARIVHPITQLIRLQYRHTAETSLVLYFDNKDMFLTMKENERLLLANHFRINHINDVVYYALSVAKQLKTKTKITTVLLGGKSDLLTGLQKNLANHFADVQWLLPEYPVQLADKKTVSEFVCLY
jgi:hypothetical protein